MSALETPNVFTNLRWLANDLSTAHENQQFTDVTLVVDNDKFHVHKLVLAARSKYFR